MSSVLAMQPGFFDYDDRHALLEKLGDPLPKLNEVVDWEKFRNSLSTVHQKPRKSNAGRKPYDVVLMFKVMVLQHLYALADEQTEYQIRDRYSFCRFLGLTPEDNVPDARTIWLFRERLKEKQLIEPLFDQLMQQINAEGFIARKGQIVDASIISTPRQRNSREENQAIKEGKTPDGWEKKSDSFLRQKDVDARWTKKHGKNHYGYKTHISIDNDNKLIRNYRISSANEHDSRHFDALLKENTSKDVWADSAYRSIQAEKKLKEQGHRSQIQHKGHRHKPLSATKQRVNRARSKIRCRVEHVFGDQKSIGGGLVRTIGLARAAVKIGMNNFVYNLRRLAYLQKKNAAGATT